MQLLRVLLPLALAAAAAPAQTAARPPRIAAVSDSARGALPRSSPERQGISSAAMLAFVEALDSIDAMHGLVVLRHGRVVAEGWWGPYDARTPHVLFSLSKSFTSTAVGLAVAEGKLSVDDPVLKFFPDDAPPQPSATLRAMRVRDLLRMNTGHTSEASLWAWSGGPDSTRPATWTRRFFAHPVPYKPGTHFLYNSPATYMLSAIVQQVTGATTLDYLRPRLFEPLGIESPAWDASPEGVSIGAFGLRVRTEDIARFGQLYLDKGVWKGRQLVPAAWVAEATALQTSNGSAPTSDWDQGYAYQFWRSRHGYRGDGAFGQYCLILPELDAVIAINSGVRDMQRVMNVVWERLLPAMKPGALPEDAAARRRLQARLAALTMRTPAGRPDAPLAARVSGRWYELPDSNNRGVRAIALDFGGGAAAILTRPSSGGAELRTPVGLGTWAKSQGGFANALDRMLSAPPRPLLAASGAWSSDSTFTVKIAATETPFHTTLTFRFDGDQRLVLDSEHHVAFGPTKLPPLVGQAAPR